LIGARAAVEELVNVFKSDIICDDLGAMLGAAAFAFALALRDEP
jgi:hypothetical protein